jgi:hypothetical protein
VDFDATAMEVHATLNWLVTQDVIGTEKSDAETAAFVARSIPEFREVAERLAPMNVADLDDIGMRSGIDPRDLLPFAGTLHAIEAGGLNGDARWAEFSRTLFEYTSLENAGEFAAMAARLGIDAERMRVVAETARRQRNAEVTELRRISPYDLLGLVAEGGGTPNAEPPVDHERWFAQARDTLQRLSTEERIPLLRQAALLIERNRDLWRIDRQRLPPERMAVHENIKFALAERLHLESPDAAEANATELLRQIINDLNNQLLWLKSTHSEGSDDCVEVLVMARRAR